MKKFSAILLAVVMVLSMTGCVSLLRDKHRENSDSSTSSTRSSYSKKESSVIGESSDSLVESSDISTENSDDGEISSASEKNSDGNSDSILGNIIRPDVKEAIDSYEAVMDEYIAFMEKYESSDDTVGMMVQYYEILKKMNDMSEKFDALGDKELTDAEALYYYEVSVRVSKKLADSTL